MRLFVALDLPEKTRAQLSKSVEQLRFHIKKANYVAPENYHLTLQFLGEVESARVLFLQNVVDSLSTFKQIETSCTQIAYWRAAQVLCAKFRASAELDSLNAYLTKELLENGFFAEERKFVPHATLARKPVFDIPYVEALKYATVFNKPFTLDTVTLYSSDLTPNGAVYTPLASATLSPAEDVLPSEMQS